MIKALIRTVVLIAAIVLAAQYIPAFKPYEMIAIVLALVTGFFGFIARTLFIALLVGAGVIAYFLFL